MEPITVRTIPLGGMRWLDCTECGPIGLAPADDAHCVAVHHLEGHGVDTTQLAPCP